MNSQEQVAPAFDIELLNEENPRTSNRFRRVEYNFEYGITHNLQHFDVKQLIDASDEISDLNEQMVLPTLKKYPSNYKYNVFIIHKDIKRKPIFIGGSKISEFDRNGFSEMICDAAQSNEFFLLTGELKVILTIKESDIDGSGRNKYKGAPRTGDKRRREKRSVIQIKNDDFLCGYRAIFVCIKYHELDIKSGNKSRNDGRKIIGEYQTKKSWYSDVQKEGAERICHEAGLPIDEPLSLTKMQQLQDCRLSPDYQLLVIDGKDPLNVIFKGPPAEKQICLEYIDNHFNAIKEMHQYLNSTFYCIACNTGYSTTHKCNIKCQLCGSEPKCTKEELIECDICSSVFYSLKCFAAHKPHMCQNVKKCKLCDVEYNEMHKHKCDQSSCKFCNEKYTVSPHYCHIKKLDLTKLEREDKKLKIIVCYDVESIQVQVDDKKFQHKAILLIAEIVCDNCWNAKENRKIGECSFCGIGYKEFFGLNCVKEFGDFVYGELAKKAAKVESRVLVFAHNSSGYDGHFVFTDLFKRDFENTNVIMKGLKILLLDIANVRFLDSLSFFQQPLSQLPKSFGISDHVIKGYFPHLFSKMENLEYEGELPPLDCFGIKYMKKGAANELSKWHSEKIRNHEYIFNYKEELIKYCANDVKILTMSVMIFRQLFKSSTKIDPMTRNFTLASVGFEYFRAVVLQDETIGICPIKGYSKIRKYSKIGSIWLDDIQRKDNLIVLREQHKGNYFVDGYIAEQNLILEFFGCKWHGCPVCHKTNRDIKLSELNNMSYNEVYQKTNDKLNYFIRRNFQVKSIWECEFNKEIKKSKELELFVDHRYSYYNNLEIYGPTSIRDSFFGGRTNNLYFTYDCKENEKIGYLDFTSLYPYVLVANSYPVGHPIVISDFNNCDITGYFGFVKCIVLPPKKLYIPVLPARINKKLYFPLCGICAENKNNETCTHSDEERCLLGTWTTVELELALEKGYEIKKIIQVLHYELQSDQIFQPYIRTWLKTKTEASGWPKNITTEEEQNKFIDEFLLREGIILDPNNIILNEGLRYIAKLMLNTVWGKLGQNTNQVQTVICNDYHEYAKIENDPSIVIKGEFMPTENTLIVNFKINDEIFDKSSNTSPAIASFVTSHARKKLYSELDKIESSSAGRVLYFDTDSIFFAERTDVEQYIPVTGNFLGDLTDEIWKDYGIEGAYISNFASSGPKNYGYKVTFPDGTSKSKCKIKGITLTSDVEKELNYDVIVNYAKEYANGRRWQQEVPQLQFRADMQDNVYTTEFNKAYRVVSEKRRQIGNRTLPYGYVD